MGTRITSSEGSDLRIGNSEGPDLRIANSEGFLEQSDLGLHCCQDFLSVIYCVRIIVHILYG